MFTSSKTLHSASIWSRVFIFGHCEQHMIFERGEILAKIVTTQDAVVQQVEVYLIHTAWTADDEFVEERCLGAQLEAINGGDAVSGVMRLVITQAGHLAQALLAQQAHIDRGGQGQETLVGADVRGGLFAADVLFAGGEGQYVSALSARIYRFTHQPASDLADVVFLGGEDAQVGAAIRKRDAQRLPFAR